MRDGEYISTDAIAETDVDAIVERMVGREVGDLFPKTPAEVGDVVLEVDGLAVPRHLPRHLLHRPGRRDRRPGRPGRRRSQRDRPRRLRDRPVRRRHGHRRRAGCCRRTTRGPPSGPASASSPRTAASRASSPRASVARNVASVVRGGLAKARAAHRPRREHGFAGPWAGRLEVKTNALDMTASTMSGGNQQKVVIAKWLATQPSLLIIDEPTRGIDVGTKAEVHRLLSELAGQGLGILMISSELPEVLGMADRVLGHRDARPGGRRARGPPAPRLRDRDRDLGRRRGADQGDLRGPGGVGAVAAARLPARPGHRRDQGGEPAGGRLHPGRARHHRLGRHLARRPRRTRCGSSTPPRPTSPSTPRPSRSGRRWPGTPRCRRPSGAPRPRRWRPRSAPSPRRTGRWSGTSPTPRWSWTSSGTRSTRGWGRWARRAPTTSCAPRSSRWSSTCPRRRRWRTSVARLRRAAHGLPRGLPGLLRPARHARTRRRSGARTR